MWFSVVCTLINKMIGYILRKDRNDDCSVVVSGRQKVKKKGKTKNHLETYSRERNARSRLEVAGGGADRNNQSKGVEKLCEGPTFYETQRG